MILINGWKFDFENMWAFRGLRQLAIHVRGNGTIGRRYKHELRKFFDPPEDHYNHIIDDAYISYCLEKQLLESDPNEDT